MIHQQHNLLVLYSSYFQQCCFPLHLNHFMSHIELRACTTSNDIFSSIAILKILLLPQPSCSPAPSLAFLLHLFGSVVVSNLLVFSFIHKCLCSVCRSFLFLHSLPLNVCNQPRLYDNSWCIYILSYAISSESKMPISWYLHFRA